FPRHKISLTLRDWRSLLDQAECAAIPPWDYDGFVDEARGENDWEVGTTVEAHPDLTFGDGDIGRHIDEIAEDLARLSIIVSAHAAGHATIQDLGDAEERHIEVD